MMQSNNTTLPQQTIEVDFVRLQDLGEYENLQSLLQCNLCDTIEVIFPRYNMRGRFKIVKTVFDVIRGKYVGMELGDLSTTLAEALGITEGGTKKTEADLIYVNEDDDVEVNAGMVVNGSLTVQGHSSPIGTVESSGDVTIDNIATGGSFKRTTCEVTVTAGVWIVNYYAKFPADATGYRGMRLGYGTSSDITRSDIICQASNSSAVTTRLVGSITQRLTTGRTYVLEVLQGSGSSMSGIVGGIVATRLI